MQQIDGDYKLLTSCSIVIFSFSNNFYLIAVTTRVLLVSFCVYFEIGTFAFAPGPFQLITVASNVLMTN